MCLHIFAQGSSLHVDYAAETIILVDGGREAAIDLLITNHSASPVGRVHFVYPHPVPIQTPRWRRRPFVSDITDTFFEGDGCPFKHESLLLSDWGRQMATLETRESKTLDSETLKRYLRKDEALPPDVTASDVDAASLELALSAHRRMTMNQSGALPGPPIERPSRTRSLIALGQRIFSHPRR
jgi:hypothetical protein